jgi:cadmium resistance protein CadD (predicted permease)
VVAEAIFSGIVGVLAFAATNLDGLFLVMVLLASGKVSRGEAVWGQVAGTAVLMALSMAGAAGTVLLPPEWNHWLGVLPLAVGVKQLWDSWRARRPEFTVERDLAHPGRGAPKIPLERILAKTRSDAAGGSGLLLVALTTVGHGGDNIGVYVALFTAQPLAMDALQTAIALLMAVLWGRLTAALIAHPTLGAPLRRAGPWLLPWVLIALGVLILWPDA